MGGVSLASGLAAAGAQSYAVGAALGTFLVVIVPPSVAISYVLVQLSLLYSLRPLIDIDVRREKPA